jgi:hypothetical protein
MDRSTEGRHQAETVSPDGTRRTMEEETPGGAHKEKASDHPGELAEQQRYENESTPAMNTTGSSLEEKEEQIRIKMEIIKTKAINTLTMEELTSLNRWNNYQAIKSAKEEVKEYQLQQQQNF